MFRNEISIRINMQLSPNRKIRPNTTMLRVFYSNSPLVGSSKVKDMSKRIALLEERKRKRRALSDLGIPSFREFLRSKGIQDFRRRVPSCLQLNIGLYCNQACNHCHVESSPQRTEMMDATTAQQVLKVLEASPSIKTVDITGGAPELNDQFKNIVLGAKRLSIPEIIVRCNLTVLFEPGQEYLTDFYKENNIKIVASLPCYTPKNVNMQRGSGVFEKSIEALKLLNSIGYGKKDSNFILDLVYNPIGATLPPDQQELQAEYKRELFVHFGIEFSNLLTISNMPIKRFADFLHRKKLTKPYMKLLVEEFNSESVKNVMCKDIVNIGYNGQVFDCDFNQMLEIPISNERIEGRSSGLNIFDFQTFEELDGRSIGSDAHCFGCTAGSGSSCGGSLI